MPGTAGGAGAPAGGDGRAARRVTVRGRVQGVFFRDSCARRARRAGVDGWIRNRADGTVEAWLEGPAAAVEQVVRWCRQGPPGAEVAGIDVVEDGPVGLEGFRIQ